MRGHHQEAHVIDDVLRRQQCAVFVGRLTKLREQILAAFFAAVFVRDAFRATVFFPRVALLGALRALAAFFARLAGARARADFADFLPVDFRAGLRAVLLVRLVGLIAVSGSGSRAECAGSAKTSLAK